jgi:TonB family protein
MHLKYPDRERQYRRRVLAILPVAVALLWGLSWIGGRIPYREIEERFGFRGPMRLLPEISVIPDEGTESIPARRSHREGTEAVNLEVIPEGLPSAEPEKASDRESPPAQSELETKLPSEMEPRFPEAPYSEDYVILRMVEPRYPPEALAAGIEGEVLLELLVGVDGRVEDVWVVELRGPESFSRESIRAVRQFVFEPHFERGEPKPMVVRFLIRFRIGR